MIQGATETAVRLLTYREFDPIDVPPALYAALRRLDGRPTEAVVAEIAAQDGLDLRGEPLRTLTDFEVLVPPER